MRTINLWDAPTRLFHWALLLLVAAAIVTGEVGGGWMEWHGRCGYAIAGLLGFRLVWGLWGSTYARFAQFVRGPSDVLAYLQGRWNGVGHNPLGALSVLGLLGVLAAQVLTGLFGNDDIAFKGPYNTLISSELELLAIRLHKLNVWVIGTLIALHIGAIAFYVRVKKDNLVLPMITGKKSVPDDLNAADATGGGPVGLLAAIAAGLLVGWIAAGGLVEWLAPPPPPPVETMNW